MAQERLQKILARGGIASRRAAEEIIVAGRVRVNGKVVTELGTKADPRSDKVELDGKRVVAEDAVYVVLHKPRGVVSTLSDPEGRPTVASYLDVFGVRLFPVGRLDFATSGALLATNDGAFSDGLLHPKRAVPKTYVVKVSGVMEKEHLDVWRNGVELDDGKTLPADAHFLRHEGDKTWFLLTIKEGRNQQIRRMGETTGYPVMRLSRTAFAGVDTEGMKPGAVRPLTREELQDIKKAYGVPRKVPSAEAMSRTLGPAARKPQARTYTTRSAGGEARPTRVRDADDGGGFGPPRERPARADGEEGATRPFPARTAWRAGRASVYGPHRGQGRPVLDAPAAGREARPRAGPRRR